MDTLQQRRNLLALLAVVLLGVSLLLLYAVWNDRRSTLNEARATTRNYVSIMEARLDATLRRIDADLNGISRTAMPALVASASNIARLDELNLELKDHLFNFREMLGMEIIDANGKARYSFSVKSNLPLLDIGDWEFFRQLRDRSNREVVFSEAIVLSPTNRPAVLAARAIRDSQGIFRGAVAAVIDLSYFQEFFTALNVGAHGTVAIHRSDNFHQVARWPPLVDRVNRPLPSASPIRAALEAGSRQGSMEFASVYDGVLRIGSYRMLDDYPFFVMVALGHDDVLDGFGKRSMGLAAAILFLSLVLLVLLRRVWRSDLREEQVLLELQHSEADLRRMQATLKASETRFRSIFERANAGMALTDAKGNIVLCNDKFSDMVGYAPNELTGMNFSRFSHPDDYLDEIAIFKDILAGRRDEYTMHKRYVTKSNEWVWVDLATTSIRDEQGRVQNFIGLMVDITDSKRVEIELRELNDTLEQRVESRTAELQYALEAARVADQVKDAFLANVSHELRTPLNAVLGMTGLARAMSTDPQQRDYLDKVSNAGKTLARIVNDLLDLSKIAAGRLEFEQVTFSLRQLLAHGHSVMEFKAIEKGLALIQCIDDDVPDVLVGDPLRLEQILLNLLSNAIKFTAQGKVELRIRRAPAIDVDVAAKVGLSIEVEDSGVGIREEDIGLLFKPFSQTDASMSRKFGGTGLGLAICKRLAEMMQGEITVKSRVGAGTLFCVKVFLAPGKESDLPEEDTLLSKTLPPVCYDNARVLVVDDQAYNCEIVEALLTVVGVHPRTVGNGQEALDILHREGPNAFDLVLMDVQMPVLDGLSATRELRKHAEFSALPVVAMTAHTMAHENERCIAAGMNDHIGKPFDTKSFYRMLEKWLPRNLQCARTGDAMDAAPVVATPSRSSRLPLADIPGIDAQVGLDLLMGDSERYRYWLERFAIEAPQQVAAMRQSIMAGQLNVASMAAHTLKGRSGMLGMKELHVLALELEAALDRGDAATPLMEKLSQLVDGLVAGLSPALQRPAAPASPLPLPLGSKPPASVLHLLDMLSAGDGDSDACLLDCLRELEGSLWEACLRELQVHVLNYNFSAAREVLAAACRSGFQELTNE